ncbi:uncharacterized protein LOC131938012 [Physella acuta]|uniref:uncharacterized protein LOC131938012 n=1 Tax=Physella acuta TaxID=109671 RepID=UPI0027DBA457|nr:uncharacterized protein LOC131938012 [Physella acuta]
MSGYSETIDMDALQNAAKALLIIFIILITISNGALVIKIMRQKQFFYSPKYLVLISLAVGDIFLALFALVIQAMMFFQLHEDGFDGCRLGFYSNVYENYILNFVYGTGLIVLSAEFVYRRRSNRPRTTTHFDLIRSFLISSFPWLLSLLIILPLSMSGVDLESCRLNFTLDRKNAQIVVSTVLPACLAVIAAVVIACFKMDRGYVQHLEMTPGDQTLASGQCVDNFGAQHREPDANAPANNANPAYHPSYLPPYSPGQNQPQAPPMGHFAQQIYINNSSNTAVVVNDNIPTMPSANAIYPEQNKILFLALIFWFLVTPLAFYYLVVINAEIRSSAVMSIAFNQGLMWLMLLRPVVTAIVTSQTDYITQL